MTGYVSLRQYAKTRKARGLPGTTHTAVRKAIAAGRLRKSIRLDGKGRPLVDADLADVEWDAQTDPTQVREPKPGAEPKQPGLFGVDEPRPDELAGAGDPAVTQRIRRAQADRMEFRAKLEALNYYNRAGELVRVDTVERETGRLIDGTLRELRAIGEKIGSHVAATADAHRCKMIINGAIEVACRELIERAGRAS